MASLSVCPYLTASGPEDTTRIALLPATCYLVAVVHSYQNPVYRSALSGRTWPRGALIALASSTRLALGGILLLALALRLWGLAFGLPYIIQPDEPSVENRALAMWLNGDANPHYFIYPSLFYDLEAVWAFVVGHLAGLFQPDVLQHPGAHHPLFYLLGRALTAAMGTLTVLVTYLTGRQITVRVGLIAALFLAVAAQHVQQSHYITVDAPTALFTAMTALFALRAPNGAGTRRDLVLAGVAAGLAAGTKYNAGIALALPLAVALLQRARTWGWRLRACALCVLACGATFLLTTPFAIFAHEPFLRDLHTITGHYAAGHAGAEGNDNALWYLLYLGSEGVGLPLTALALAGIPVVVMRYRRPGLALLAFTLPYYALLCSTFVRFDRNLLPLLPFLALLAAVAADTIFPRMALLLRNKAAAYVVVLGLAAVPSLNAAATTDFAITHPFTEQLAVAWADTHLPRGAALATENWEGRPFDLSPRQYRITHLGWLAMKPYRWLTGQGVRYVEADSYTDGAFLRDPRRYPVESAYYRYLYTHARLLQQFTGDPILHPGPTIRIYELPS